MPDVGLDEWAGTWPCAGHDVVGVDIDPILVDAARQDYPAPRGLVADLAELDLPAAGIVEPFDVVIVQATCSRSSTR